MTRSSCASFSSDFAGRHPLPGQYTVLAGFAHYLSRDSDSVLPHSHMIQAGVDSFHGSLTAKIRHLRLQMPLGSRVEILKRWKLTRYHRDINGQV